MKISRSIKKKNLTNAEMLILGLVAEIPRHGYEFEQVIEQRGMREWTQIGFSSIYFVLGKLEKSKFVSAKMSAGAKAKKIYSITENGHRALVRQTLSSLREVRPTYSSVLLGMAHWPILDHDAGLSALKSRKNIIETELARLENILTIQQPLPDFVEALFDFSLGQLQAEAEWVMRTLDYMEVQPLNGVKGKNKIEKIDFKKTLKKFYLPTDKDFVLVDVPEMRFLMIDGEGDPGGEAYTRAVQWLYSVAYPIKFIAKKQVGKDFVVPPLEGLWWADDMDDFISGNKDRWKWRMMIALPGWADQGMFEEAVVKASKKLGERPNSLRIENFTEGKCVQIMHIGPYSEEAPTIARMHKEYIPANGLIENGYHHEIYLNDPRRTAPEKLKTVLRQPVR